MPSSQPGPETPIEPPPSWRRASIEPLAGDASTRRFFRLRDPRRATPAILMVYGDQDAQVGVELFRQIAAVFRAASIRVPAIYEASPAGGYLVVEDLGDTTLEQRLRQAPAAAASLYTESLTTLTRLRSLRPETGPIADRRLDAALFRDELDHTMRWLVAGELGIEPGSRHREEIAHEIALLTTDLQAQPVIVCHRDFHSRNILETPTGQAVVDFQDARLGPYTYDLASLAHDPYAEIPPARRHAMRAWLLAQWSATRAAADIERDLDRAVLQRSLKAAGTYAYQHRALGRTAYRSSIPRALHHALGAARRLRDLPALESLIEKCRQSLP